MLRDASFVVTSGFVVLPLLVAFGFVFADQWAGRRLGEPVSIRRRRMLRLGAAVVAWLMMTWILASSGVLHRFELRPPPFAALVLAIVIIGVAVPCSALGARLVRGVPLWALVGFQVFRFPLEVLMHQASIEGVIPVQMTYSGLNYDVVSGITGGALGGWLARASAPRWVVAAWNVLGFALLVNIVTIALLSTPVFHWFGADRSSVFVTYVPFVWLPAVLVTAALMGHVLVWRWLAQARSKP